MGSSTRIALSLLAALAAVPAVAAGPGGDPPPWTLQSCIRTALEKHGSALAATSDVDAARAQTRSAGSSLLYPKISAQSSLTRGQTQTQDRNGSASDQQNQLQLGVTFWDGGVQRQQVRRARAGQTSAEATLQRTRQTLAYNVTDAYIGLLRARRTLKVADEKLADALGQKTMVDAKIKAGAAAEVDIYPIEVQIASARVEQIKAAGDVQGAQSALRSAMGLETGAVPEVAELPDNLPEAPSLEECLKQACEKRPEVQEALAGVEQQRANLDLARLQLRPLLNVGAGLNQGVGGTNPVSGWNVSAGLSWSLYDRGDRANVDAARAMVSAVEAQQQQTVRDIGAEVEQAYVALASARERTTAADVSVTMARKNLEAAEARYKQGLAIPIEIVDAQVAFSNAELQAIGARYDYLLARAQLDRAIGNEVAQ